MVFTLDLLMWRISYSGIRELSEETVEGIVNNFIKIFNHESDLYGHVIIITYEAGIIGGELRAVMTQKGLNILILQICLPGLPFQQEAVE